MRLVATALCLALVSCVGAEKIVLPDGGTGYTIGCGGTQHSWNSCYKKAGEVCPGGYEPIERQSTNRPYAAATQQGLVSGSSEGRTMVIRCK